MRELWEIYLSFFKMSSVTFGGGYAMLPILQREIVEKKNWMTHERIIDYYAVSQGLPGIIAVNVAIFIGRERKGALGGIAGAMGIVSPCLLIITFIAAFLNNFQDSQIVKSAFAGIAVCVAALILNVVIGLWKKAVVNTLGLMIFAVVFFGMILTNLTPIAFVLGAAFIGIIVGKSTKEDTR